MKSGGDSPQQLSLTNSDAPHKRRHIGGSMSILVQDSMTTDRGQLCTLLTTDTRIANYWGATTSIIQRPPVSTTD
jgi:hypothetical protein